MQFFLIRKVRNQNRSFRRRTESYIKRGRNLTLYIEECVGNEKGCSITYPGLAKDVKKGDKILIDDGLIELEVQATKKDSIVCLIENGGELERKRNQCAECKN